MSLKEEMHVQLRNHLSELERLANLLEKFGEVNHLPLKAIMDINLALDEIFTNIVSYGFEDDNEHFINIHISKVGKELTIKIEDSGVPFNPLEVPDPELNLPLEERTIGGLGIHFVKNMVQKIKYERLQDKNVLVLKKILDS
ncbi:ATP-binding protein [Candidatus Contubernalis alkaliaceticus]|uniref:ATP-binding protein n=1 Tax=Candidatus Contubernalis alkaliaceticus TaxID=338645 RepID=UPI001F4C49D6|nr:ATP-binding protein [Candidatus Contubernalis alkalaceticus]